MRRFWTDEEFRVEVNRRICTPGMVDADRNARARAVGQVAVHTQRDRDVGVVRKEDVPHRHGLQRLVRQLAQYRGRIEPDFGAFGGRE